MQNAAFAAAALDWVYLAFDVPPDELGRAIAGAKALGFCGLNITVPHKVHALELVDELDKWARLWGAINTIVFEAETTSGSRCPIWAVDPDAVREVRARGFNTDADGFIRSVREDLALEFRGARVLVLGAGGAGRVIAMRIAAEGVAELYLVNRTRARAEAVAAEIHAHWPEVKVELGYPAAEVDLLVNATSLGMNPNDPLPLDTGQYPVRLARAVYDLVYRPPETGLIRLAHEAGVRAVNGLGMLLYQGALAFELWTGRAAPVETMRKALEREVYGHGPVD